MEYRRTHQPSQPYGFNPAYASLPEHEQHNFLSTFPPHLSVNSISNSASSDHLLEGYTWAAQDNTLGLSTGVLVDPLLQMQPAVQVQNVVREHSADEQDWRQAITRLEGGIGLLEDRMSGLEVAIKNLQNDIEEKTRFFADVEIYIKQLVEWTRNSKQSIDSLVGELKEAVKLANSK